MNDPLAHMPPRHASALAQATLFRVHLAMFEIQTQVSADEMQRWHERGLLSFDPHETAEFDERHRLEVTFLAGLVRSGLPDAWIDRVLDGLPKPYCYDPHETFYSFTGGCWVTLPAEPDHQDVTDQYLRDLADAEDWEALQALRACIDDLLTPEDADETEC